MLDRDFDIQSFSNVLGNTSSSFRHHPTTGVLNLKGGADAIPLWGVASGKIFRLFTVEQNAVAGHQKLSNPQKLAQSGALNGPSLIVNN